MELNSILKGIVLKKDIDTKIYFDDICYFDLDKIKYTFAQFVYIAYLEKTQNNKEKLSLLSKYKEVLIQSLKTLNISKHITQFDETMIKERLIDGSFIYNYVELIDTIFHIPYENEKIQNTFINITRNFYIPFLHAMTNILPIDLSEDGLNVNSIIIDPTLLIPSLEKIINPNTQEEDIYLVLYEVPFTSYSYDVDYTMNWTTVNDNSGKFFNYLKNFNLSKYSIDELFLLLSNFAFEQKKYDMIVKNINMTIFELIRYTLLDNSPKKIYVDNLDLFIQFLNVINKDYRIGIQNSLVSSVLKHTERYPDELIGFLQKSPLEITVAEMESFRNSVFSRFNNILLPGIESIDNESVEDLETPDIELDNTNEEPIGSEESGTDGDSDETEDGFAPDVLVGDDSDKDTVSETDTQNQLNDTDFTIEIAKKDTFQDYLFRVELMNKIQSIINSGDTRFSSSDIYILKRFKAEWMNLLSIRSIKQFLAKLSFVNLAGNVSK